MLGYFPFGLPGPQVPGNPKGYQAYACVPQAYEDEWIDELVLVDLGDSWHRYGYTVSTLWLSSPLTHPSSGYLVCDIVMMTKPNQ